MDLGKLALLLTQGSVAATGSAPSGSPSAPGVSRHGTPDKWRAEWTNGDATAYTRIYFGADGSAFGSATLRGTVNPGVTSFDTTLLAGDPITPAVDPEDGRFFYTHFKNGQESSDVSFDTAGS